MAGRGRLALRAALSRAPRWVMVLGIVLLLAVAAGIAALLGTGTVGGPPMQMVVLKVDGFPSYLEQDLPIACNGHGSPCSPPADIGTVRYTGPTGSKTYQNAPLPFTATVQVPVSGGVVTLDASSDADSLTCSIVQKGVVLNQASSPKDLNRTTCRAPVTAGRP